MVQGQLSPEHIDYIELLFGARLSEQITLEEIMTLHPAPALFPSSPFPFIACVLSGGTMYS